MTRAVIENGYRAFTSFPDAIGERPALSFSAVIVRRTRDGLIVHERHRYDFAGFLMEIGVLEATPA